jgi:predicted nucleotidyltransferase component of viral defense system
MTNLVKMVQQYVEEGYSSLLAEARVCQDIVLKAISESAMNRNVTIKGGVVMRSITHDVRRATRDIDFDFIKYSIDELSINAFIEKLNVLEGISLQILGEIEELSQQEYRGKRTWVAIKDDTGYSLKTKMDIGVHKNVHIEQDEYCFDVCHDDEGVSLLMNSKEQIFAEKLRALVKFGTFSGRVKDIFDLCYLTEYVDSEKLLKCVRTYILDDPEMLENDMDDVIRRVKKVFNDREFVKSVENSKKENWLGVKASVALERILECLNGLS